jgi:branched-subunit amino acid aminotransferase/4-amino-4-deoxychorismate lyase
LLEARDHDADDALMLSGSGHISEAASGNIFWLKGESLYTPTLATGCLMGTTRAAIMRLFEVEEIHAGIEEFLAADAAFLCNVRHGIWPIAALMPHARTFETRHPRLLEIAAALEDDRNSYITLHARQWA